MHPSFKSSVQQISPLGGPLQGGTALTVTGKHPTSFVDLGDAKCRFGVIDVPAVVRPPSDEGASELRNPDGAHTAPAPVNGSTLYCASPPCVSPRCGDAGHDGAPPAGYSEGYRLSVSLEVSMDGVLFSRSGRRFTYYDMRAVAARDVAPWGGPAAGGTLLRVHGQSLGDYSGRAGAMRWQGLRCLMGGVAFTAGTRERDGFAMRCHAPDNPYGVAALPTEAVPGLRPNASALTVRALELTLNGQVAHLPRKN